MAEKHYYIVWNESKTEGYITDDEDDAEFARVGWLAKASCSTLAQAMRETYANDDDEEDDDGPVELPTGAVTIEV